MGRMTIRRLYIFVAIMGIFLFTKATVLADQLVIGSDEQFDFAASCMTKGDYTQAVSEFKRFIHFFPGDPRVVKAWHLIGTCYLNEGRYKEARETFSKVIKIDSQSLLAGKAIFLTGESFYREGKFEEAEYYFTRVIEKYPSTDLKNAALYRLGWTNMQEDRWQKASETFERVEKEGILYDSSRELMMRSLKGASLPYKDPKNAGILAGILPGLGHVYVSRYKDAVVAFLLNGVFIWAAVESFSNDLNVLGGILSFFEVGWYAGNIYSAVNAAHKVNRKVRNDFRKSLKDRLDFKLLTSREGPIGLAMRFEF